MERDALHAGRSPRLRRAHGRPRGCRRCRPPSRRHRASVRPRCGRRAEAAGLRRVRASSQARARSAGRHRVRGLHPRPRAVPRVRAPAPERDRMARAPPADRLRRSNGSGPCGLRRARAPQAGATPSGPARAPAHCGPRRRRGRRAACGRPGAAAGCARRDLVCDPLHPWPAGIHASPHFQEILGTHVEGYVLPAGDADPTSGCEAAANLYGSLNERGEPPAQTGCRVFSVRSHARGASRGGRRRGRVRRPRGGRGRRGDARLARQERVRAAGRRVGGVLAAQILMRRGGWGWRRRTCRCGRSVLRPPARRRRRGSRERQPARAAEWCGTTCWVLRAAR